MAPVFFIWRLWGDCGLNTKRVAIVGAGIAGLSCACALRMQGFKVSVFERSPRLADLGAGIQISPNGVRVLEDLGVAIPESTLRSEGVQLYDGYNGNLVFGMNFSPKRFDTPFYLFHRADLIECLAARFKKLGGDLKLGHELESLSETRTETRNQARLNFKDKPQVTVDLAIGADGVKSKFRAFLNKHEEPFFTKQVAWRAIIPMPADFEKGFGFCGAKVFMAARQHVVIYPIRSRQFLNIVAVEETEKWTSEGWNLPADPDDFRQTFSQFGCEVENLFKDVSSVSKWGLFRHDVAASWGQGAVAMIGDAAHPTLPFLAQGANLALEDAWLFAKTLAKDPQQEALHKFQNIRVPRVTRAIHAANKNAQNYHLGGMKRRLAHTALRLINIAAPNAMMRQYSWLYDYDVKQEISAQSG